MPSALSRAEHLVAIVDLDDVEVPDVDIALERRRQGHAGDVAEQLGVAIGRQPSLVVPALEAEQLGAQDHRLHRVEPRVRADVGVLVLRLSAVVAHGADAGGDLGVVREHRSGVAVGTKVLARVEARPSGTTPLAAVASVATCSLGLGGVFDQRNTGFAESTLETFERGDLAEQVDRQDGPRRITDRVDRLVDVDQLRRRIAVDEAQPASGAHDCFG